MINASKRYATKSKTTATVLWHSSGEMKDIR